MMPPYDELHGTSARTIRPDELSVQATKVVLFTIDAVGLAALSEPWGRATGVKEMTNLLPASHIVVSCGEAGPCCGVEGACGLEGRILRYDSSSCHARESR
jgi:hypothetical protein